MVNRQGRDQFAEALRHLTTRQFTTTDYEQQIPRARGDNAIHEIFRCVWTLYDDNYDHKLDGPHKPTGGLRLDLARCMLFLKTDLEYEWPRLGGLLAKIDPFRKRQYNACGGDFSVWPFFRRENFNHAKEQHPPYLAGENVL